MDPEKKTPAEDEFCHVRMVHLERVERARREAINERDLARLTLLYRALGDPTRARIVMALMGGEMCVCDLSNMLNISQSAVSHQLRTLRQADLVRFRKQGKVVFYSLKDEHIRQIIQFGLQHVLEK